MAPAVDDIIVLSTDGKGVVMRPEGLREATRKQASSKDPTLRHRLSTGEKHGRKRRALVAAVYSIAPFVRTPQDIVQDLAPDCIPGQMRPKPHHKRVWAGIEKDARDIIADVFAEALRRDLHRIRRWAVLVDGNVPQLEAMISQAKAHRVDVTIVIDIIHVIEYLWGAAWCLFSQEKGLAQGAESWVSERLQQVLAGRCASVAAGMRRSATKRKLAAAGRRGIDVCAAYLLNNRAFLRYDAYLAAGLPIRSNGDFEAYWDFHRLQRQRRHHLSRYAGNTLPAFRPAYAAARAEPKGHLRLVPNPSS